MRQDRMYYKVTQEYLQLNGEKRKLMQEKDKINAQLEVIEGILIDLNDILCKHGNHIYEHFEERESQESEEIRNEQKAEKEMEKESHHYD